MSLLNPKYSICMVRSTCSQFQVFDNFGIFLRYLSQALLRNQAATRLNKQSSTNIEYSKKSLENVITKCQVLYLRYWVNMFLVLGIWQLGNRDEGCSSNTPILAISLGTAEWSSGLRRGLASDEARVQIPVGARIVSESCERCESWL